MVGIGTIGLALEDALAPEKQRQVRKFIFPNSAERAKVFRSLSPSKVSLLGVVLLAQT